MSNQIRLKIYERRHNMDDISNKETKLRVAKLIVWMT
jgi:hypothetical protein